MIYGFVSRLEHDGEIVLANLEINETIAGRADCDGKVMRQGDMPAIGTVALARYDVLFWPQSDITDKMTLMIKT